MHLGPSAPRERRNRPTTATTVAAMEDQEHHKSRQTNRGKRIGPRGLAKRVDHWHGCLWAKGVSHKYENEAESGRPQDPAPPWAREASRLGTGEE